MLSQQFSQREARLRELNEAVISRVEDACRGLIALDDRVNDLDARHAILEDRLASASELEDGVLRRVASVEQRCSKVEGSAGSIAAKLQRDLERYRYEAREHAAQAPPPAHVVHVGPYGGGGGGGEGKGGAGSGGAVSREEFDALQEHILTVDASVQQFSEQLCKDVEVWQGSMRDSL